LGAGVSGFFSGSIPGARSLAQMANGDVAVGGTFLTAGGHASASFARLTTTCPATATAFGSGCTGSGGPNELGATSLPWLGSTFVALATGMPANGLVLRVTGFSTALVPLPTIVPQGGAGCTLLAAPDALDLFAPSAGAVATSLVIPNVAALAGQVVHQQVVPFELGAGGAIVAVTSSNRLTLVLGQF
jgi:hypothetical protein